MLHKYFSRFLTVLITVVGLFVGCASPAGEDGGVSVYHKWVDSYSSYYEITKDYFKNYGNDYSSYEGNNVTVIEDENDKTQGTVFIKYTVAINSDNSFSETAPDVGKWYAIRYNNLKNDSVSISGVYKENGKTATETLEEAKIEFTQENGYFAYFSECVIAD